jgi:hypothetical protein
LPSNSATISGFADLRQTNFRFAFAPAAPAQQPRIRLGRLRRDRKYSG